MLKCYTSDLRSRFGAESLGVAAAAASADAVVAARTIVNATLEADAYHTRS